MSWVLFHAILIILERQCIDQLPGGKYWNTNDNIKSMVQNVLSTNKMFEGGSGMIDLCGLGQMLPVNRC